MIDKAMMVSQNCTKSETILVDPYGETYTAFHNVAQALTIKAEEISDTEEEEDSVPKPVQEMKTEPEVSYMFMYMVWPRRNKTFFLKRIPSSGTLCHVALVRTDVSEERSASIIRVTRISELGTTLAVTSN
jgi:hypothetical protein